jgi:hypothetical protein
MKTCTTCLTEKPFSEFYRKAKAPDGHQARCKPCQKAKDADYYRANKDAINAKNAEWRAANPDKKRKQKQKWRAANPDKRAEQRRRWKQRKKAERREARRLWLEANPKPVKPPKPPKIKKTAAERAREYREKNRERMLQKEREYRQRNRGVVRAKKAARRAQVRKCVRWLTEEQKAQMVAVYNEAQRLTRETGIEHHVDHIAPLRGKTICGLHVPRNLRVLPAEENIRKQATVDYALIELETMAAWF